MNPDQNNARNPLAVAFSTAIVVLATGLLWMDKLTGGDWVTTVIWVTSALMLGQAASIAASGYVVSSQARLQEKRVQ